MLCGVLFGSVFYDISPISLISPIDNKTTIPLQIIRAGLFMIYRFVEMMMSEMACSLLSINLSYSLEPIFLRCP